MADPIEQNFRIFMQEVAIVLDELLNGKGGDKKLGFCLHIFKFGEIEDGMVNYISNANRADMIAATKEGLARVEGRYLESPSKQ